MDKFFGGFASILQPRQLGILAGVVLALVILEKVGWSPRHVAARF